MVVHREDGEFFPLPFLSSLLLLFFQLALCSYYYTGFLASQMLIQFAIRHFNGEESFDPGPAIPLVNEEAEAAAKASPTKL